MTVRVDPFVPLLGAAALVELRRRLSATRLPPSPVAAGWERGVEASWQDELLRDWAGFDVASVS